MTDEGYIKFQLEWIPGAPAERRHVEDLIAVREKLFQVKLIGRDSEGVAYGNISKRISGSHQFYITGTQTGGFVELSPEDISLVLFAEVGQNVLRCSGMAKASSEALTHWAIYEADQDINAVIHVHHRMLWQYLMREGAPTTGPLALYGTPQMGKEVQRLYAQGGARESRVIAMGGHECGVLSFGGSLEEAYAVLMSWYARVVTTA